jgi:hypothetical protein
MFRIDQIMTATTFLRSFKGVAERLSSTLEPLLITKRDGGFIVIMDGEFFEGIMSAQSSLQSLQPPLENEFPCNLRTQNPSEPTRCL